MSGLYAHIGAQLNCLNPLPSYMVAWETTPPKLQIQWDLAKVCHSTETCYGQEFQPKTSVLYQLKPSITQPQAVVTFSSSISDLNYYTTDETGFSQCNFTSPATTLINNSPTLRIGSNYFIAISRLTTWLSCEFGLRLNISVQDEHCHNTSSSTSLCNSYGRCVAQPNETSFKCECCQPYYGEFCLQVDGCYGNAMHCMNGGTCIDGDDLTQGASSFTCKCIGGYVGRYCQSTNTEVCPRNECSNNGECKVNGANSFGFTCTCPPGFIGNFCQGDINECLSSPCLNNATCADGPNSYSCTCLQGFTGVRCDRDERPCRPGVCFNGATCIEEGGNVRCECPIGFKGNACVTEVLTCQNNPCSEHSLDCVVDTNNNFTCICKSGFTGHLCNVNIDECASNPCGAGTCIDEVAGYKCICSSGNISLNCLQTATKAALDDLTNTTTPSSSSSSSAAMIIVVGVVVIVVLIVLLALLVLYFIRSGIMGGMKKRKIYAIEIRNMSKKDRIIASPDIEPFEFFDEVEFPRVTSCLSTSELFKRNIKKTEKF